MNTTKKIINLCLVLLLFIGSYKYCSYCMNELIRYNDYVKKVMVLDTENRLLLFKSSTKINNVKYIHLRGYGKQQFIISID